MTVTALTDPDGAMREMVAPPPANHLARNLGQPQRLTQVALETRFLGAAPPPAIIPELAMRGWLAAPLTTHDGRSYGVVQLSDKIDGEFSAEDEGIVVLLAQKASVAIENIAAAEAREANRLKDEFLGVLSHELRTPLQAMLTWIAILRKEPPDAALLARSLDVIERSARSQVQLIADLLDVSRIIRGQLRLDSAPVEVVKVIGMALEALRPSASAKQVTLVWTPPASECWIVGDSARLQQVVWNLVSNGIKFTPAKGRVEVELDGDGDDVTIRVRDTGSGIPAAFLPYVFDRFRQADSTTERQHGGLGLGLSIVRHLVELHSGKVRAENAPDGGALISVVLPRLSLAHSVGLVSGPSAARPASNNGGNQLRLDGINVVLVEDEPDAREALTTALERFGAAVVAVESAAAALQALKQHTPDVLLSDIGMPVEDGYTLIRKIRAAEIDGAHLPAAALTAYGAPRIAMPYCRPASTPTCRSRSSPTISPASSIS
jgi:signal transduction histidine kinase